MNRDNIKDILKNIKMLDTTEDLQEVIQGIANYLSDAYENCQDESLKKTVVALINAHNELNERQGR